MFDWKGEALISRTYLYIYLVHKKIMSQMLIFCLVTCEEIHNKVKFFFQFFSIDIRIVNIILNLKLTE